MSVSQPVLRAARCFSVTIGGMTIGEFAKCTGLEVNYEVFEYAEGGQNGFIHKFPGGTRYSNLVLTRGITREAELLNWLLKFQQGETRSTVTVSLLDETGRVMRAWGFSEAFPVRWTGPTLADEGEAATETLEIGHNGLVRV
jgi:phage tail-like protein